MSLLMSALRSRPGRVVRAAVGLGLIAYGATHPSLAGVVMTMVGVVPVVTALAGICLLEESLTAFPRHRGSGTRPREHPGWRRGRAPAR